MSLDRLVTLYFMRPARQCKWWCEASPRLPVLMYHSISDDPESGKSGYYKVCTSPKRFEQQMQWLAESGWEGVTLSDGLDMLNGRKTSKGRPVAITFDDGFRDFHTDAAPVLDRHGFLATMYLPTAFIGEAQRKSFKSRECLIWSEVAELDRQGIEFGSHTVNHPVLVSMNWQDIERELRESREEIEDRLQKPLNAFAYPYAFPYEDREFVVRFKEILTECQYVSSATTMIGTVKPNDELCEIRRIPVNSADDLALFLAKLSGAFDWLSVPQKLVKHAKRFFR